MAKHLRQLLPKPCALCTNLSELLYRVRIKPDDTWLLICAACWPAVKIANPHYRYGGTWKAKKRL